MKTGPLTSAELQAIWQSVVDDTYAQGFIQAGEGNGFEAHTQAFQQFARVSQAIDTTMQEAYLLPWSGQTGAPAAGAGYARVTLQLARPTAPLLNPLEEINGLTGYPTAIAYELTLPAGTIVQEVATDFSDTGSTPVITGRQYQTTELLGFGPGVVGPLTVQAQALAPGQGFNNPQPGTLTQLFQPGAGHSNNEASVVPGTGRHQLITQNEPDTVIPEHVGQYCLFIAGANVGQLRLIIGYVAPTAVQGPTLLLAATIVAKIETISGMFTPGEMCTSNSGAIATLRYQTPTHLVLDRVAGTIEPGNTVSGLTSGATVVFDSIDSSPDMIAETGTAWWSIVSWADVLGLTVTNLTSPEGGTMPVLDELGREHQVFRSSSQTDTQYRQTISTLQDTISPNALRRAIARVLMPLGLSGQFREVGTRQGYDATSQNPLPNGAGFQGLFFDGNLQPAPYNSGIFGWAYDLDFTVRPADRFKLLVDYLDFRAFFLVGVPHSVTATSAAASMVGIFRASMIAHRTARFTMGSLSMLR